MINNEAVVAEIINFEMLSDKNIKKMQIDTRNLYYRSIIGRVFKIMMFLVVYVFLLIELSTRKAITTNIEKALMFILMNVVVFTVFIFFRKYLFEKNSIAVYLNSKMMKYINGKRSKELSIVNVYFQEDSLQTTRMDESLLSNIKYSEFYKMYELEYGYYFKISRKSVFYFPYSEFSNEAIPKLNEIFRKNGIIIQKSYK